MNMLRKRHMILPIKISFIRSTNNCIKAMISKHNATRHTTQMDHTAKIPYKINKVCFNNEIERMKTIE